MLLRGGIFIAMSLPLSAYVCWWGECGEVGVWRGKSRARRNITIYDINEELYFRDDAGKVIKTKTYIYINREWEEDEDEEEAKAEAQRKRRIAQPPGICTTRLERAMWLAELQNITALREWIIIVAFSSVNRLACPGDGRAAWKRSFEEVKGIYEGGLKLPSKHCSMGEACPVQPWRSHSIPALREKELNWKISSPKEMC
jgi:hypothetical protein